MSGQTKFLTIQNKNMKQCYHCRFMFPLFMYGKAVRFTIKTDKGRNRLCRICTFKESKKAVVRWHPTHRFQIVKLTLRQRIKQFFN